MIHMTADGLRNYLTGRKHHPTLVVGHPAPDGDAAVSSVMEGWRRQVTEGISTLPVLLCDTLPAEVAWLFGDLAALLCRQLPADEGPVVLTDHHVAPHFGDRVMAIVDHHLPAPGTDLSGVDACIRPVGATTSMIATAWQQQGLLPDPTVARILLGGILLDTEGLTPRKTTEEDRQAVSWLTPLSGERPTVLYAQLLDRLLSETDITTLYQRDHRVYHGDSIGFAILKVWRNALPDKKTVRHLLATETVAAKRQLCVAKIALYDTSGVQEEYYLTAGEKATCERFLSTVLEQAKGEARRIAEDEVFLPAGCPRHGRKWYARHLLQILTKKI